MQLEVITMKVHMVTVTGNVTVIVILRVEGAEGVVSGGHIQTGAPVTRIQGCIRMVAHLLSGFRKGRVFDQRY